MARSLNIVVVCGNVGAAPEVKTLGSNTRVANFSLATSREWTDRNNNNEKKSKTEWHRITVFGAAADIIEKYVKSGDRLTIKGRLEYNDTDKPVGGESVKIRYTTIVAEDIVLDRKHDGPGGGAQGAAAASSGAPATTQRSGPAAAAAAAVGGATQTDDLPF